MRKKNLLLMGIFSLGVLNAQVGINTKTPSGVLHIDHKSDTNAAGTSNLKDDVIIAADGSSGVNMSIGGVPIRGASIALHSANKGFIPNRVELISSLDIATIPLPEEGMIVYNVRSAGAYPNNVLPGYYQFNGTKWARLKTSGYLGISETLSLANNVTTVPTTTSIESASVLDFGVLEVFEDGAYAFSFNVAATSSTGVLADGITRGLCYIHFFVKKSDSTEFNFVTTAEFAPPLFGSGQSFTISTIKSLELRAGDQLKFRVRHYTGYPSITYKAGATFLVYWQL